MVTNAEALDIIFEHHNIVGDAKVFDKIYFDSNFKAFKMPDIGIIPRRQVDQEKIIVPCTIEYTTDENFIDDHFKTIIAAGTDRNMMVYNADDPGLNRRIAGLMITVSCRNSLDKAGITHILVDKKHKDAVVDTDIDFIFCDMEKYYDFYLTDIAGSFPANRSELIIGLDLNKSSFHRLTQDYSKKYGMGVLYSRTVLLGAI